MTLAGKEPEYSIAAERRRFPAGVLFITGWLSHLNLRNVPVILLAVVVLAFPHFWHLR